MKISKQSWHYRLYRYLKNIDKGPTWMNPRKKNRTDVEIPKSLCPYVWSLVFGVLGVTFFGAVVATLFAIASPFLLIIWGLGRAQRLRKRLPERKKNYEDPKPKKAKNEPLVKSFVKARKDKVCPTIELVD